MRRISFLLIISLLFSAIAFAGGSGTLNLLPFNEPPTKGAIEPKSPPVLEESRQFWIWDLSVMPPTDTQITAICKGIGSHAYIFVEDGRWGTDVTQTDVDAVLLAWDQQTPSGSYDSSKGIYDIETQIFGPAPDVDGDPPIYLLYYEFGEYGSSSFDGFFRIQDEYPGEHSNQTELLHLNTKNYHPSNPYMLGVAAHEFNHMIHMMIHPDNDLWIQESLAEAAMVTCGYFTDTAWMNAYANNPGVSLYGNTHSVNYGACFLFGAYFYEQAGPQGCWDLVHATTVGTPSVEEALVGNSDFTSFPQFMGDWSVANYLDEPDNPDGPYGYDLIDVPDMKIKQTYEDPLPLEITGVMTGGGVEYRKVMLEGGHSTVEIELLGDMDSVILHAVFLGTEPAPVYELSDSQQIDLQEESNALVLSAAAFGEGDSYSYTASLSYQDAEDDDAVDDDSGAVDDDMADDDSAAYDDDSANDDDDQTPTGDDDDSGGKSGCGC